MNTEELTGQVYSALEEKGYRASIVPVQRLADLKAEVEGRRQEGVLDETLYRNYLSRFRSAAPEAFPHARSLIITSAPQPQQRAYFTRDGQQHTVIIPPTYSGATDGRVEDTISAILAPAGYSLHRAGTPLKLLAVRSGLARYGRNNITYVEGTGSFHRLKAFLSDLPAAEDGWSELRMLEQCETCTACARKCPTGAIAADRFLLHAEKCLTFHNESTDPFPDWIEASWHNCLIGCMHCQTTCPVDREFIAWFEDTEIFTEDETALILKGSPTDELLPDTAEKLRRLYLLEDLALVARNLGALLR